MCDNSENSPWLCHVCDATGTDESTACAECFKTTCRVHLQTISAYNQESGLYELRPVCIYCMASELLH